jgi:hypothetical protein
MPIIEPKPWRRQFFDHVPCPEDVMIPLADTDAWGLYPRHRWIYDKLDVALSQGLDAAPHGVMPPAYPVFSKPITNLRSMGTGSRVIASQAEYESALSPGHFWCTLLTGAHVSTDVVLVDGRAKWWRHATGITRPGGTFDYWHIHSEAFPEIEGWCGAWAAEHLSGYSGMANFETIGGRIIELHLRFADQWPDLYGAGWVEALVDLYVNRRWVYDDSNRVDGYSVVLFGPHGRHYRHPSPDLVAAARAVSGVLSVQISFYEDKDPTYHPMPPGGFRLATVNAVSLPAGQAARDLLGDAWS